MQDDAIHAPLATGSAALIYGWTLQEVVLILWAIYVIVLITIKVPDFAAAVARIRACLVRQWEKLKRWKDGSEN